MTFVTRTTAIAALLTIAAGAAQAQNAGPLSLEVRAGASVPTRSLGTRDLDAGFAYEITANLQVMPHLNLYAGHGQAHFGLQQPVGAFDEFENCGYAFGARFFAPSLGVITPWIRAGGTYTQLEFENDDNDGSLDSGHELGWEAGAGATVALGGRWSLLPGVRYRTFSPEMAELGGDVDLGYLAIDIGISATFGGKPMAAIRHR